MLQKLLQYMSPKQQQLILDALTFETGLGLDTNSILGEYLLGPNNTVMHKFY